MTFQVITGSGHCGTMWLARVLDSVPGQRWTHELRTTLTGMQWWEADDYRPDSPKFDVYWDVIRQSLDQYAIVGDSNSWPPELVPLVNRKMPIDRVIYLTRDKGKQLYSLLHKSPIWKQQNLPEVAKRRLGLYAMVSGREPGRELLVEANDFMPGWVRAHGLTVDVYSLEELTTDVDKLRELAQLDDDELREWQGRNINQKVFA